MGSIALEEQSDLLAELQDQLRWSRLLLRAVVDNLPSAVYAKDLAGRKILANEVDCRNAGVKSEEELLGKTDFDFFPRHIAQKFYEDDCQVLKDGKSVIDREEKFIKEDGNEGWLRTSKIPIRDEQGKILGLVGFGHDITVEKQLEIQNATVQEKIREQQALVENMMLDLAGIPQRIGELVNGITYIAKQTKMVSINAAIESARVGEQGRGFQIVAEEVGRLSDQSSNSASQVRDAINEVDALVKNILQLWEEVKLEG